MNQNLNSEAAEQTVSEQADDPVALVASAAAGPAAAVPAAAAPAAASAPVGKPGPMGKNQSPDRLGTEPLGKLLLEFSIPAIIMMVFNMLYNVVDTAFLGWAIPDGSGVAVMTLAVPVMTILMAFPMLAGQGGSALGAIQLGRGDKPIVERTLGNTTVLLIGMAAIVAVCAWTCIEPLLDLLNTPDAIRPQTRLFLQIICVGSVFQCLGMGLNNFLRVAGKPNLSLATSVFGTVMCIIFNYIFVILMGQGVAGSAVATILGQCCGMIPVIWYFVFAKTAPFHLRLSQCRPDVRLMGQICMLGMASFAMQCAQVITSLIFNEVVTKYGSLDPIGATGALASIGVGFRAMMITFCPLVGITMGAQPIIGYNYGARNWQRVLDIFKLAAILGTCIGAVFFAFCQLAPELIVSVFGLEAQLAAYSARAVTIMSIFLPLVGFQVVGSSYFQASGQPVKAAVLSLTRQVLFLIPLYLLAPPVFASVFGVSELFGVVCCIPTADLLSVVFTTGFVVYEVKKLRDLRDGRRTEVSKSKFAAKV